MIMQDLMGLDSVKDRAGLYDDVLDAERGEKCMDGDEFY